MYLKNKINSKSCVQYISFENYPLEEMKLMHMECLRALAIKIIEIGTLK